MSTDELLALLHHQHTWDKTSDKEESNNYNDKTIFFSCDIFRIFLESVQGVKASLWIFSVGWATLNILNKSYKKFMGKESYF